MNDTEELIAPEINFQSVTHCLIFWYPNTSVDMKRHRNYEVKDWQL